MALNEASNKFSTRHNFLESYVTRRSAGNFLMKVEIASAIRALFKACPLSAYIRIVSASLCTSALVRARLRPSNPFFTLLARRYIAACTVLGGKR